MQSIVKEAQDAFQEVAGNSDMTQSEMLQALNQRISDKIVPHLPQGSHLSVSTFVVEEPAAAITGHKFACKLEATFGITARTEEAQAADPTV